MTYECEECGATLSAGLLCCPKCGQVFDEAVPQDAKVSKRGWQSKTEVSNPQTSNKSVSSVSSTESATLPISDRPLPVKTDQENWQSKSQHVKDVAANIITSPSIRAIKQTPLLIGIIVAFLFIMLIVLIRPHTNSYVFEQHPTYQSTMTSFMNVVRPEQVVYSWPFEGHEDRLGVAYHNNSYSSSETLSKSDLDRIATAQRLLFCALRYRSGFTPDEAMRCQVYVSIDNLPDAGYNGPEVAPDQDAQIKDHLDQIR